jgi:hypothetical protein
MQHPEENFDALRRALKLKRHEQPPPGYFKDFSSRIISRIRENDVHDRAGALETASWEAPWLARIVEFFQSRPAYAGTLGVAACALMIGGIVYSERPAGLGPTGSARFGEPVPGVGLANTPTENSLAGSSTSPVGALTPGTTLFDKVRPGLITAPALAATNLMK